MWDPHYVGPPLCGTPTMWDPHYVGPPLCGTPTSWIAGAAQTILLPDNLEDELSFPGAVVKININNLLPGSQHQVLVHKGYG
jgi:hypothetical protein